MEASRLVCNTHGRHLQEKRLRVCVCEGGWGGGVTIGL